MEISHENERRSATVKSGLSRERGIGWKWNEHACKCGEQKRNAFDQKKEYLSWKAANSGKKRNLPQTNRYFGGEQQKRPEN